MSTELESIAHEFGISLPFELGLKKNEREDIMRIGSLDNPNDIKEAVTRIKSGQTIAFQVRNVFGLIVDGKNGEAVKNMQGLKGMKPDKSRPFSGMLPGRKFATLIDSNSVHPNIKPLLDEPKRYSLILGMLCHVRAPIRINIVNNIPDSMISFTGVTAYMHNLDPHGHLIENLVTELEAAGVEYPCITTANTTKVEREISNIKDAIKFCSLQRNKGKIPILLQDRTVTRPEALGSFPILDITYRSDGSLNLIRHGHVPTLVLEKVLRIKIDQTTAKKAVYAQPEFEDFHMMEGSPEELRLKAIAYLGSVK
ncbi:hypothetical protein A2863_02570 [Candidatus Woesebacteria bacterium RIFCSPHIGHO2_01_FULL_38_9b]|uniref:YrdC-like domain-containing protein n=1 Tax=Candidatus Woesebacteria bacterium RIFCSPHIGHO2_01_FULL_38_9b TaxID=1802493 RepID=A0A1F7Y153_9BACT|nr:MAG: hypothetical protein A2863_02570 [Candidatus Woesebacteria bacterium RIFCSPHIGHO2_01_FULL_38_9b]